MQTIKTSSYVKILLLSTELFAKPFIQLGQTPKYRFVILLLITVTESHVYCCVMVLVE